MGHKFILEEFSGFNHVIAVVWVVLKIHLLLFLYKFVCTLGMHFFYFNQTDFFLIRNTLKFEFEVYYMQ